MTPGEDIRAVLVELPASEWEALAHLADADDRTLSQMATRLLRRALREALVGEGRQEEVQPCAR